VSQSTEPSEHREPPKLKTPFGFVIERKIDFLAAAAFLLSLSAIIWQVWNWYQGAEISLFPPDQITIVSSSKAGGRQPGEPLLVRFVVPVVYANQASQEYSASILREYINVVVGDCKLTQRWYQSVTVDLDNNGLVTTKKDDAVPFPVKGGSSISHETLFTFKGDLDDCFGENITLNDWHEFNSRLSKAHKITVFTSADLTNGRTLQSSACTVTLAVPAIQELSEREWITGLPCGALK
jgi:hypothetical protein